MKRILMDFSPNGVKTALTHDGELVELVFDNYENASVIGNIYVGLVERVIPGQFAFVNAGLDKNCFLQIDDYIRHGPGSKLKQGEQVVIQAVKDENQAKGVYVSAEIALTGRFIILMKSGATGSVSISQKIEEASERRRLKSQISEMLPKGYSVIVRTQGEYAAPEDLKKEIDELHEKLEDIFSKSDFIKAPALLYCHSLIKGTLELFLAPDIDEIIINDSRKEGEVAQVCNGYLRDSKVKISVHEGDADIFNIHGVSAQIEKALNEKVWLKSGGFLLIEETKTCNIIDVNTGKYVKEKSREKLILRNNMEAAGEIARQIRLRNLSGMILIDFVDLFDSEDKKKLLGYLEGELKKDRIVANIVDYSALNIVQLTRKKTRPPLSHFMRSKCPCCNGTGYAPRLDIISDGIYKRVKNILTQTVFNSITVKANEDVVGYLRGMGGFDLLEEKHNAHIDFKAIKTRTLEHYVIEKEKRAVNDGK